MKTEMEPAKKPWVELLRQYRVWLLLLILPVILFSWAVEQRVWLWSLGLTFLLLGAGLCAFVASLYSRLETGNRFIEMSVDMFASSDSTDISSVSILVGKRLWDSPLKNSWRDPESTSFIQMTVWRPSGKLRGCNTGKSQWPSRIAICVKTVRTNGSCGMRFRHPPRAPSMRWHAILQAGRTSKRNVAKVKNVIESCSNSIHSQPGFTIGKPCVF